jgi:hypothetical protein
MSSTLQTYLNEVQRLIHDVSNAAWSQTELIDYINTAREDAALDMHCVRHLVTGVQLIQGQEIYSIDGAVCGATVTAGGTGYSAATTVTFGPAPAGGVTALGTAAVTAGAVTAINMTRWGQGYVTGPNITIADGGGSSGAAATAVTMLNAFQVISISNIWNLNRYMLGFRGFTLFQAYMRQSTTLYNSRPGIWTIHPQDLNVYLRAPPDQLYLSEWDMLSLPAPLVNVGDVDVQVRPPWNKALQYRAAALALSKHQNFEQAEYYDKKYDQRVPRFIIGAGGIRIPNPYNRSFQRKIARGAT